MVKTINDDIPALLPWLVAETVTEKYFHLHCQDIPDQKLEKIYKPLATKLEQKAEHEYQSNILFKEKLNSSGNVGRDHLYKSMNIWIIEMIDQLL